MPLFDPVSHTAEPWQCWQGWSYQAMRGEPEDSFILAETAETGAESAEYQARTSPELVFVSALDENLFCSCMRRRGSRQGRQGRKNAKTIKK
jgi:hypothetical protein